MKAQHEEYSVSVRLKLALLKWLHLLHSAAVLLSHSVFTPSQWRRPKLTFSSNCVLNRISLLVWFDEAQRCLAIVHSSSRISGP